VLSAGGLRGAAHVGVLRALVRQGIRIDAIVGVSAGAVVAAYYAAVGLGLDDLTRDAQMFRGRHLIAHSLALRAGRRFERQLGALSGIIPKRLEQLEHARFDRLHHGIRQLAVVCHDIVRGAPCYFATGADHGIRLAEAVKASAAIPSLFRTTSITCEGEALELTDGGLSDPVPVQFARSAAIGATHVIVSDCRSVREAPPSDERTVWVRPRVASTGTLWSPARGLVTALEAGQRAVSAAAWETIASWNLT
jgi:NTE family protein